ncbi:MAG: chromosomal replication initiator protein DnaA [Hyphomicrobiales bacterium]|nr:chromosomal replication initiator protein DnaA [Hyphomicrobiales bacterium]MBV8825227.1 chromosomal replication initiator protein DnaA [Hyphomicrobiales bacterium]MBV9428860.1 chromosomal replication initiator protein DnaA [Bradyrhizobiaceae bacterium]
MHTNSSESERWGRVKQRLRAEVGDDVYSSWFTRMDLDATEGEVVRLSVPTRFLKSWIQAHYIERVLACWRAEEPGLRRVELAVRTAVIRTHTRAKVERSGEAERVTPTANGERSEARTANAPTPAASDALGGSPLDPRLTFDAFLVGRSNTLAHAAAKQVASARCGEPVMFNPLYIHAGVGLGKTHLLQAIAWAGGHGNGSRKVLYLTVEKFMYGFVAALKTQTAIAFKEALRGIDVLVIDDLQFLQGKSTQAEFCHTLNALIDAGRQVVIAADRSPSDLETLDERVRSRLAGGLVVEMGSHEEELRLEILKSRVAAARAHHVGFDVPGPVLAYIAKTVTHNGRDLDGALNRLLAHNKLTGQVVTVEMAERAVRDLVRPQDPKRVKIEDIQRIVARQYNVSRADLLSSRRTANVVRPRQIAMYLAKALTLRSLPEIGRRFGGRDHTTVLHAVRKIETLAGNDSALAEEIELLKRLLQEP